MLKIFLAEDEFVIREGIKKSIDWKNQGYEFVGDAADGELAYSMILKNQPDILITDIKMPFMDGLTLSRMIKAQFPWIEIILLTGYEDFEYAKEAIRIGVSSYLSKPISGERLLREIKLIADKIDNKTLKSADDEKEILSELDPRHIDRKRVKEFLRIGEEKDTDLFLTEFADALGKSTLQSTMLRQYIAMDIYFCVTDFIENELCISKEDYECTLFASKLLESEKETFEYLKKTINTAIVLRKDNSIDHNREVVNEVIGYIDEHYSDEELSLNELADHVNFSPNHLSAIFRQQTGQTLIKYLTDYRMDKAKEMLISTGKKSNEIGSMVGYKDPHYFSHLFKKTQGMTTTQYRGRASLEDK